MKQGVLPRIIFSDLPVLRYVSCAAVSKSIAMQNLQKLENKSCRLQDSRNCNFSTPWNTQTHKKYTVSRCSDTQDRKLSCLARVDMNLITHLRFDYVREGGAYFRELTVYTWFSCAGPGIVSNCPSRWTDLASAIQVNWTAPERPNGMLLRYHLQLTTYDGRRVIASESVGSGTLVGQLDNSELRECQQNLVSVYIGTLLL